MSINGTSARPAGAFLRPTKWWHGIKRFLGFGQSSVDLASYYVLRLYRTNLELRLANIDTSSFGSEIQKRSYEAATEMLKAPIPAQVSEPGDEWDDVYKIESLIALVLTGPQLREEINARLHELAADGNTRAVELRAGYEQLRKEGADGAGGGDVLPRALLLRIMEEIHWAAKKKFIARPIRKETAKHVFYGVLIAFTLLVAPYIMMNLTGPQAMGPWWSLFPLYTALAAGLCGAFFSRAMTIRQRWNDMTLDEVFLHRELSFMILRAGIGACGALIVYFFLMLGPVANPMFPVAEKMSIDFAHVGVTDNNIRIAYLKPSKDLALLMFWCFLAGFSEALVPNILASAESQITQAGTGSRKNAN